jgi:hypothetical protein
MHDDEAQPCKATKPRISLPDSVQIKFVVCTRLGQGNLIGEKGFRDPKSVAQASDIVIQRSRRRCPVTRLIGAEATKVGLCRCFQKDCRHPVSEALKQYL